jgi:hypothetical protein
MILNKLLKKLYLQNRKIFTLIYKRIFGKYYESMEFIEK